MHTHAREDFAEKVTVSLSSLTSIPWQKKIISLQFKEQNNNNKKEQNKEICGLESKWMSTLYFSVKWSLGAKWVRRTPSRRPEQVTDFVGKNHAEDTGLRAPRPCDWQGWPRAGRSVCSETVSSVASLKRKCISVFEFSFAILQCVVFWDVNSRFW